MQEHNPTDSLRNFQDTSYGYRTRSMSRDGFGWCCRNNDVCGCQCKCRFTSPSWFLKMFPSDEAGSCLSCFLQLTHRAMMRFWGTMIWFVVIIAIIGEKCLIAVLVFDLNTNWTCFCLSPVLKVLPLLQWCKSVLQVVSTTQHHCRVWSKVFSTTTVTTPNSDVLMIIPVYRNIGLIFMVLVTISIVYFSITH